MAPFRDNVFSKLFCFEVGGGRGEKRKRTETQKGKKRKNAQKHKNQKALRVQYISDQISPFIY